MNTEFKTDIIDEYSKKYSEESRKTSEEYWKNYSWPASDLEEREELLISVL